MSTLLEKENVAVRLHEQKGGEHPQESSHRGEVGFLWRLHTTVQPATTPGKWRVQMTVHSEGSPGRSFSSDVVEVAMNEPATVTFPTDGEGHIPDSFWVERFESVQQDNRGEASAPEVGFRLVPDHTGAKPEGMIILNTSMTFYWIIGARNIALTEISF